MTTKRILLAVDRSPGADAVANLVADTARGAHATVRLLHVASQPSAVYDAEGRVVPPDPPSSVRSMELRHLVEHLGVVLQRLESMGNPFRHVEHPIVA